MPSFRKRRVVRSSGAVIVLVAIASVLNEWGTATQSGWQQVHPLADAQGRRIDLLDVQVLNANQIYAVGRNGTILRSDDFGARWTRQTSGTTRDLYGVSMRGETGVAVGDWGTILRTTNGGRSWADATPRNLRNYVLPSRDFRLFRVAHAGPTYLFAVGGLSTGYVGAFSLRSTDAGATWTDITPRGAKQLRSVDMWSANIGYAVGGVVPAEWDIGSGAELMCCPDGRGLWQQYVPPPEGEPDANFRYPLRAVAVGNAQTAYVFQNKDNVFKTTNGGRQWTRLDILTGDCYHFYVWDADFADRDAGLIVGDYGMILRTTNGGDNWTQLRRPTRVSLAAVSMLDRERAAVVGPGMTALTTTDGGGTWRGTATQTTRTLNAVSFVDSAVGIAVGDGGDILRTTDGGSTWISASTVNILRGLQFQLTGIDMLDTNVAVAVGGAAVLRSSDGGDTWSEMPWGSTGVAPPSKVSFLDSQQGLAVSGQSVAGTSDGRTWTLRYTSSTSSPRLRDVHFAAADLAVAVGDDNTILRSTNGGHNWAQVSITAAAADLMGVHFVDSRTGWAVGERHSYYYYGFILKTTDGGVSWRTQSNNSRHALRDVFMATPTAGVIVGGTSDNNGNHGGIILRTTNGVDWVEQPSLRGVNYHGVHLFDANSGFAVGSDGRIIRFTRAGT